MSWWRKKEGKEYLEELSPIERMEFIINKIAEASDYTTAAEYFKLFNSPEAPSTVEEIKRYLKRTVNSLSRRILQGHSYVYGKIPNERLKRLYKPIRKIFEKCKDKQVLFYKDGKLGHAKMHPFLIELYDLSKDQTFEITTPGSPTILQLTLDSNKTDKEILSDELYLCMCEEDARLLFAELPTEFKEKGYKTDYKLTPIEIEVKKEEKPKEVHEFSIRDITPDRKLETQHNSRKKA